MRAVAAAEGNDRKKVKKVTCMYEKCHRKHVTLYTNLKHLKIQLVPANTRLLQKLFKRMYNEVSIEQHCYYLNQGEGGSFLSVRCRSAYPVC